MQRKFYVNIFEPLIKNLYNSPYVQQTHLIHTCSTFIKKCQRNLVGVILIISLCEKYKVWHVSV